MKIENEENSGIWRRWRSNGGNMAAAKWQWHQSYGGHGVNENGINSGVIEK
jgi:hypothetical protein